DDPVGPREAERLPGGLTITVSGKLHPGIDDEGRTARPERGLHRGAGARGAADCARRHERRRPVEPMIGRQRMTPPHHATPARKDETRDPDVQLRLRRPGDDLACAGRTKTPAEGRDGTAEGDRIPKPPCRLCPGLDAESGDLADEWPVCEKPDFR